MSFDQNPMDDQPIDREEYERWERQNQMSESGPDKYSRVQQMILDRGQTWDLSPNDQEALRHVLGMVNVLADRLAAYMGGTVGDALSRAHAEVERGEG